MDDAPPDQRPGRAGQWRRSPLGRVALAVVGGGLLWLAWVGYAQPGLLLQLANLRYCG
ncbi:MAG: hypothetical protein IPL03_01785 [Sterolibacteriaceae bacterium]|nr:hypothetical protein [Candidatus Methylophosphatis haderslevensis]